MQKNNDYEMHDLTLDETKDFISVSAGAGNTLAIKKDGSLWAWGMNCDEKLGIEAKNSDNVFGFQKTPARVFELRDGI